MKYSYKVLYPTPNFLEDADYGKVAHLPCIFDSRPGYHRNGSRYLIDRGLGFWDPKNQGIIVRSIPPTPQSIKNYAEWLANFLEWCDVRCINPMSVKYVENLIGGYQTEMSKGIWSSTGRGLSPSTINHRIDTAIDFLNWAAFKGLRNPLLIPTMTRTFMRGSTTSSLSHTPKEVQSRKGKVREPKRRLGFPLEQEIYAWIQRICRKEHVGSTQGLLCETILETAIRRSEAAGWRVDTLPLKRADWHITNPEVAEEHQAVLVNVKYGAKGPNYGDDHGDKIGPEGTIRVPLPLALKLDRYRNVERPKALEEAMRKGRTASEQRKIRDETVHLFLNPTTGQRYTNTNIYDIWRSVERPKDWSPHSARHFWACSMLMRRMEAHHELLEHLIKMPLDDAICGALISNALTIIQLEIQPQLRHKSQETTLLYLQWYQDMVGINLNLHQRWVELGEKGNDGDGE